MDLCYKFGDNDCIEKMERPFKAYEDARLGTFLAKEVQDKFILSFENRYFVVDDEVYEVWS